MERLRYVAASLLLGFVTAVGFMPMLPSGAQWGPLRPWSWRPVLPMVVAVAAAAWLVRPLCRLRGRAQLWLTGSLLALLSASLFAFLTITWDVWRVDGTSLASAIGYGLRAMPLGFMMCVLIGYVTLPMGVLFVWLVRPLAGPPPCGNDGGPARPAADSPGC